jgi:hypothetical protein
VGNQLLVIHHGAHGGHGGRRTERQSRITCETLTGKGQPYIYQHQANGPRDMWAPAEIVMSGVWVAESADDLNVGVLRKIGRGIPLSRAASHPFAKTVKGWGPHTLIIGAREEGPSSAAAARKVIRSATQRICDLIALQPALLATHRRL